MTRSLPNDPDFMNADALTVLYVFFLGAALIFGFAVSLIIGWRPALRRGLY